MPHIIWKGAITFGLVHVPVALLPAASESGVDFDWIDRRSMDPVGYQRINKRTGHRVAKDDIVRGVKVGDGRYVVLKDEEIAAAYPKSTRTIEIEGFVAPAQVPFMLLERPYYLEPLERGEKVDFEPARYADRFTDAVHALVEQRVRHGETKDVTPLEEGPAAAPGNVVDLTELLVRSLKGRRKPAAAPARRKTTARKRA